MDTSKPRAATIDDNQNELNLSSKDFSALLPVSKMYPTYRRWLIMIFHKKLRVMYIELVKQDVEARCE